MRWLLFNPVILSFFRRLMFLWVKVKVMPEDIDELKLDGSRSIRYVLDMESFTNFLVLDQICITHSLPRPVLGDEPSHRAAVIFHRRWTGFLIRRPGQLQTSQLQQLVQHADQNNDWDAQLVPVSIFWGTAPGRERS
ncbi:MAG: hypothetical protein AAF438_23930, partial [Pseudomonadota bacterium]